MTNPSFKPWPPYDAFPESYEVTPDGGTHFPSSAGDRERGKFRPGTRQLTTRVAVSNDDGSDIGVSALSVEEETLLELKAIRIGIQFMLAEFSAQWLGTDLRDLAVTE